MRLSLGDKAIHAWQSRFQNFCKVPGSDYAASLKNVHRSSPAQGDIYIQNAASTGKEREFFGFDVVEFVFRADYVANDCAIETISDFSHCTAPLILGVPAAPHFNIAAYLKKSSRRMTLNFLVAGTVYAFCRACIFNRCEAHR